MAKITANGELTTQSEKNITTRIAEFETKYNTALMEQETRHKAEIAALKEDFQVKTDTLKSELDSIRQLIEGKSDSIKLSDNAVETVVKSVATEKYKKLENSVTLANEKNNSLEQYTRTWCVRLYGVAVDRTRENAVGPVKAAMEAAYNTVIQPILVKVADRDREAGGLDSVPSITECIENAHKLGKDFIKNGKTLPPCIIVRFMKREIRDIVIKNRKFAPAPSKEQKDNGVEMFRVVEDLTRLNHQRLQSLIEDNRVEKVWSIQGKFRLILKDDVKKTVINCRGAKLQMVQS